MAKLICTAMTSLDGYIADAKGDFTWAAPDAEVHAFVNDQERDIGTYLYGRRLYDTMVFWETAPAGPAEPAVMADYAELWRAADKIVYSTTLTSARSARTRVERTFDADAVRALKDSAERDFSIGGAELAAHAFRAGLVDEVRLFISPVIVGGGTRFLPDELRLDLRTVDERRFDGGCVHLRYLVSR
ncbi:dihydrofolate reductase family protein [Actinoplanes sp. NPDC051513]|uniref:dihydrofolate reductase family protein n=1 Tax=Actinoplanes sp. NPDC051513 TaxID=3363908 RepID=UPI0037B5B3CF